VDSHTLELLEFDKVRGLLAARAACALGKAAAERIQPGAARGEIESRQALTSEMVEALRSGLRPPLGGLHDIVALVRRAALGAGLEARELAQTVETLRAIRDLAAWTRRIDAQFPRLGGLRQNVGDFSDLVAAIESSLDERGEVLDAASRRLMALRREIVRAEERIQETLRELLRSPDVRRILRYPNFTMVGHHYVLPVARDHFGELPGAVHRSSASNETLYVEPAAIGARSARLSFLRAMEQKEVRRILRRLSALVGMASSSLLSTLEVMAELDLVYAQARLSMDYRMSRPEFNEQGRLTLRAARHPLLEALFRWDPALARRPSEWHGEALRASAPSPARAPAGAPGTDEPAPTAESAPPGTLTPEAKVVVPIDVQLGIGFQILVVTGPNTGGKTVALKTVGLLALMAQSGLHIPAEEGSQLPVFDDVLADIGDEQSLEQSLSTFSSHVRRIAEILQKATVHSLVLLDELGAGTDPADGAALGRAILDELDRIGSSTIVTTHIGDLKTYAFGNPRAENAAAEFDDETLKPRYRLRIGDIGESNALKIARQLLLSQRVIDGAEAYLKAQRGSDLPGWEAIAQLRREAQEAREAAVAAQAEADRTRGALAARLAEVERESAQTVLVAEARARLQAGDRVVVPRLGYDRPGRLVKLDLRKKTALVAIGHVTWTVAIDELVPLTIRSPAPAAPVPGTGPPH
jgi:DNA mismatch repair protein MutS2